MKLREIASFLVSIVLFSLDFDLTVAKRAAEEMLSQYHTDKQNTFVWLRARQTAKLKSPCQTDGQQQIFGCDISELMQKKVLVFSFPV